MSLFETYRIAIPVYVHA